MDHATSFTPVSALIGGALIGLSALMLLALNGRVAGVSGIAGLLLSPHGEGRGWRLAFVLGLVAAALLYTLVAGAPQVQIAADTVTLVIAGVLVGIGTQLGSGCTSGHGVCGLSRLSARSLVATISFMAAGVVTVFLVRHVFGG
jgi:uncharacterized protein